MFNAQDRTDAVIPEPSVILLRVHSWVHAAADELQLQRAAPGYSVEKRSGLDADPS